MILQGLIDAIPKVFYLLTMSILSIIDFFQLLMRKLAGLDCYYVGEGANATAQTGDIVYDFVTGIFTNQYPILSTVFWGLVILGFILLFLSTIIAIIRSEYTTEKADNGKGKIMFKAFKSVVFFAIVPIVSIMGIYLANLVLVAVDKATTPNGPEYGYLDTSKLQEVPVLSFSLGKPTETTTYVTYSLFGYRNENYKNGNGDALPYGSTTTTFSGIIFKASAYNANRVRVTAGQSGDDNFANLLKTNKVTTFDNLFYEESGDTAKLANKIDIAFGDNVVFKKPEALNFKSQYAKDNNNRWGDPFASEEGKVRVCADKFNVQLVWYYYDLWSFNFVIALGAAIICATIFINIIFGLMRRIIEVVGLFLIAPPLIGLMPLDNEKAYGNWRGNFIKKVLMAYGAIGGMNIIFLLLPELQTIRFFNNFVIDGIVDTIIVLVALLAVKDFIGIVSNLAGGDDANKVGEGVGKDVGELSGKALKIGASTVGMAAGVGSAALKVGAKGAKLANYGYRQARQGIGNALEASGAKSSGGTGTTKREKAGKWLQTSHLGTAKDRSEHIDEDRANADAKAKEEVYNKYRNNAVFRDAAEDKLRAELGDDYINSLKMRNMQKFEEMVETENRRQFEEDFKNNKDEFGGTTGPSMSSIAKSNAQVYFDKAQADRNVSMRAIARKSDTGKGVAQIGAWGQNMWDSKNFGTAMYTLKSGLGQAGKWAGSQAIDVGKPVISSSAKAVSELTSYLRSNSFYQGFMGKDNDTLADIAYRLAGTNKKEIEKAKTKAKEAKAQAEQLAAQQQMILNALRQLENEKRKR